MAIKHVCINRVDWATAIAELSKHGVTVDHVADGRAFLLRTVNGFPFTYPLPERHGAGDLVGPGIFHTACRRLELDSMTDFPGWYYAL